MDKEKTHFSEPGDLFIIVRKLTKRVLKKQLKLMQKMMRID